MFKKIKEFLFGKPAAPVAGEVTTGNDASWAEAKEVADVLKAVAVQKQAEVVAEAPTPAPQPEKKKRMYTKRPPKEPKAEAPAQWPFPVEKPSEGVTLVKLKGLEVEPIEPAKPAAMKVRKPRKAVVPKQD